MTGESSFEKTGRDLNRCRDLLALPNLNETRRVFLREQLNSLQTKHNEHLVQASLTACFARFLTLVSESPESRRIRGGSRTGLRLFGRHNATRSALLHEDVQSPSARSDFDFEIGSSPSEPANSCQSNDGDFSKGLIWIGRSGQEGDH